MALSFLNTHPAPQELVESAARCPNALRMESRGEKTRQTGLSTGEVGSGV